MATQKLSKRLCDSIQCPDGKDRVHIWDSDLPGFGLCVMASGTKTFYAQRDLRGGRTKRLKVGRFGPMTVEEARRNARQMLALMDRGIDPAKQRRLEAERGITLQTALEIHVTSMTAKNNSTRVIDEFVPNAQRYFSDWMTRPLRDITREEVRKRHRRITSERGPYAANAAMRAFRSAYNTASNSHDLPEKPCKAVNWNAEERRQAPIPPKDLLRWWERVSELSPVRRDYQLFVLLTGLRREDAATVRWQDVGLAERTLHRPKPKGGKSRAFTIPLSDKCIEVLERRKAENDTLFGALGGDAGWVFPTLTRNSPRQVTHLKEPKEEGLQSPHRLRDTYTTACNQAGLSPYDIDVLTNHRPPKGSVAAGYINPDIEHLRQGQQRVTDLIMSWLIEKCAR